MKKIKFILPIFAFAIAMVSALASNANRPLVDFYGVHPTSGACVLGSLEDSNACTNSSGTRCEVTISGTQNIPAWRGIDTEPNPDVCVTAAFRN